MRSLKRFTLISVSIAVLLTGCATRGKVIDMTNDREKPLNTKKSLPSKASDSAWPVASTEQPGNIYDFTR